MKKLAVMVEVDVATSSDPAFVFRCCVVGSECGLWQLRSLLSLSLSLAAAATFYNSVSSVFKIEATVRTERSERGAEGEEGAGEKYFYSNSMPKREGRAKSDWEWNLVDLAEIGRTTDWFIQSNSRRLSQLQFRTSTSWVPFQYLT